MYRILIAAIIAMSILACGDDGRTISEDDYGRSAWPLTVDEAKLHCEKISDLAGGIAMVWVEVNDLAYPLNGIAMDRLRDTRPGLRVRDLKRIWRDNPTLPGYRIPVSPLIDDGLKMCGIE